MHSWRRRGLRAGSSSTRLERPCADWAGGRAALGGAARRVCLWTVNLRYLTAVVRTCLRRCPAVMLDLDAECLIVLRLSGPCVSCTRRLCRRSRSRCAVLSASRRPSSDSCVLLIAAPQAGLQLFGHISASACQSRPRPDSTAAAAAPGLTASELGHGPGGLGGRSPGHGATAPSCGARTFQLSAVCRFLRTPAAA